MNDAHYQAARLIERANDVPGLDDDDLDLPEVPSHWGYDDEE